MRELGMKIVDSIVERQRGTIQILAFWVHRSNDLARKAAISHQVKASVFQVKQLYFMLYARILSLIYWVKPEVKSEVNLSRTQVNPQELIYTYNKSKYGPVGTHTIEYPNCQQLIFHILFHPQHPTTSQCQITKYG